VLERKEERPLPDFRSVDLLRQAREEQAFSPADYNDLRRTVLEEDRSHPTAARQFATCCRSISPTGAGSGAARGRSAPRAA